MVGILNRYHKTGILLLCVITLGLLARFGGMSGTLTKTYGDADPTLTATVTGLVGEDTISYAISRAEGEDAGTYPSEEVQGNYKVVFTPGVFTITPKSVSETGFTNTRGDVCRIDDQKFQTLSSAVEYVKEEYRAPAVIQMLTDYAIPAADMIRIPANCEITLSTAPEYEGEGGIAVISRAPGNTGFLFTNEGILHLGGEALGSQIILDGTGVEASKAMIFNDSHGTLNVGEGATIRNADIPGDNAGSGGAIRSAGTVNISGGVLQNNSTASSGGAIYATGGAVNISGGTITGNRAMNGGAVFAAGGAVNISGGTITGNRAMNGGAVFAAGGAKVTVTGGTLTGNSATHDGGAIYVESGVTVEGGLIGGKGENDANRAANGAAIFVAYNGVGTFKGGEITGNVATAENGCGGAVGIGSEYVRLFFSDFPKIIGNTIIDSGIPANVCLDQDSENVINANDGLDEDAEIGIYVPGDGEVYRHRGVPKATFGRYISETGIKAFRNDRTPKMRVQGQNNWLTWGKSLEVETRYITKTLTGSKLPPQLASSDYRANNNAAAYNPEPPYYYPADLENYVSDIAAEVGVKGTFACAFAATAATQYSDCISMINWDSDSGDWIFRRADGREGSIQKLIIYYADPTYISVANNTPYTLNIDPLTLNGIDAGSNRFGVVVARKGETVEHFVPLDPDSDFVLKAGEQIRWMFPNVSNQQYEFHGCFYDESGESEVNASIGYFINGEEQEPLSPDFTVSGTTASDSNSTVEIAFREETNICKIVELAPEDNTTVKEEHLYSSLALAINEGVAHYEAFKIHVGDGETGYDTVKIEMIRNYQIPAADAPNIPAGFNFTLTTATPGQTKGELAYNDGKTAQISRHPNNTQSFITVNENFDEEADAGKETALTIENLDFDGRLVAGSSDGGAINAQKCSVTIQSCNFTRFEAGNGGGVCVKNGTFTMSGGSITGCSAKQSGGGVCVSSGTFTMSGGSITNCEATQSGGGVCVSSGTFTMSGGSITNCEATQNGGGVCVNNGTFTMSGGAITGNSAGVVGGGIAVGGTGSKLNFSGNAVVYNNTKSGAKCNVELNYASNQIINTSGLGADALIGVYVPGEMGENETEPYKTYGGVGDIFGSRTGDSNLFLFVNDRDDLRGWQVTDDDNQKKVHWVKTQSLAVRKEVVSDLASDKADREFEFTVTLTDDSTIPENITVTLNGGAIPEGYGFKGKVATFKLKHGDEWEAQGLPGGSRYTVTETPDDDFTITSTGAPASGTIDNSSASSVEFTNTRKLGKLTITKTVDSPIPEDLTKDYVFKIELGKLDNGKFDVDTSINAEYADVTFRNGVADNIPISGGSSKTIQLPCGLAYRVSEAAVANMTTTMKDANGADVSNYAVGTIIKDADSHVTFTNKQNGVDGVGFKKVDGSGEPVKNAVFKLYTDFECQNYEENTVTTSDLDGIISFNTTLSCGDHYMKEEPLDGYVQSEKTYLVHVGGDGDNVWPGKEYGIFLLKDAEHILLDDSGKPTPDIAKYGIMNVSDKGSRVILRKIGEDGDDQYKSLENAVFDILYWDKTPVSGASGLKSASNGVFWVWNLPHGKYYLRETTIPDGYAAITEKTENWFMFEVKADEVTPILYPLETVP